MRPRTEGPSLARPDRGHYASVRHESKTVTEGQTNARAPLGMAWRHVKLDLQ